VGLLDYYKRFEALSEEEVNSELRAQAADRKAKELAQLQTLDLAQTTWPEPPHPNVVGAITFVARRGLHRYPRSSELASELAHRLDLPETRIALGNGASELMQAAAVALMRPEQALLSPWPSYPLFPILATRAHGIAVPVSGGVEELIAAAGEHRTRVIALASPNDPTGELLPAGALQRLLANLPETVAVLLDQSLVEYAGPEAERVAVELLEHYPRLLVFRSFSKAWGLAGLRCGYALCGPGAEDVLSALAPDHGVSELSQAAALESLRSCEPVLRRRVAAVAEQRSLLATALRERGFQCAQSAANFLWIAHERLGGGELAAALRDLGVLVAPGAPLGEQRHVRVMVSDDAATKRLLSAIDTVLS
jgi:histidinol-phosphate aminotransferase